MKDAPQTLGDLADSGMDLAWYCDDCSQKLRLDLGDALHLWGREQALAHWRPPIVCAVCRGRNVSMRVQAKAPNR